MKIKKLTLLFSAAVTLLLSSCSRDENQTLRDFAADSRTSAEVDLISDDIGNIIEDQYNQQAAQRNNNAEQFLPECVIVTATATGNTWQRIIDFGDNGCEMYNGNVLKGIITINGTTDFTAATQTLTYSFTDFYHNNRQVTGNRFVTRVLQNSNGNPQSNITLDLVVTLTNGTVITRQGNRIREWIAGDDTPFQPLDNEYSVTGTWTTNFPDASYSTTVASPLIVKLSCPRIVQGTQNITGNSNNFLFDYGNGACDNIATLSINGGDPQTISLGL